jgi:lipoyl(octanoyl) transferase
VTSLVDLGLPVTLADVDLALRRSFDAVFSEQAAT